MSALGLKIVELHRQIEATEGHRVIMKLSIFDISVYTFNKNNEELLKLIEMFDKDSEFALYIQSEERREDFDFFLMEITRLLHNCLASAKTLIDHTRKVYQDEYIGTTFEPEYNQKIKDSFAECPLSRFIQDLRNYSLHRTLPITGATITFHRDKGMSQNLYLQKEELMDWDGWTKKSKEYLEIHESNMKLLDLIEGYLDIVTEFQNWFREKQIEFHKGALDELEKLQEQYNILHQQMVEKISKNL